MGVLRHRPLVTSLMGAALILLAPRTPQADTTLFDAGSPVHIFPARSRGTALVLDTASASDPVPATCAASPGGLQYHGGPVIHRARQKSLWWGTDGFEADMPSQVSAFFSRFGRTGEYETITQYADLDGPVQPARLSSSHKTDPSPPPSTVTDADAQAELIANFENRRLGKPNDSTLYYLFLPEGVTSTAYGMTSCVDFCAYHSFFSLDGMQIKYAVVPYPDCWGCEGYQLPGHSAAASSVTIFTAHETREAVTDPLLNAWWDSSSGQEADDKCAWQLFIDDDGFQYQKEWSLAANACVTKGVCGP